MDSYFSAGIPLKYVWRIPEKQIRFSFFHNFISSPKILAGIHETEYELRLTSTTNTEKNGEEKKFVTAFLSINNVEKGAKICGNLVIYVKSSNLIAFFDVCYTDNGASSGVILCSTEDLFNKEKKYIIDGYLTVEIKGILFTKSSTYIDRIQPVGRLCGLLSKDDDDKDFMIVVGKKDEPKTEIKVHKFILSLRSPVFKRMFETNMKEKEENKVDISDFDAETVLTGIAYCYDHDIFTKQEITFNKLTVNLKNQWQKYIELLQFSDKYDIADLRDDIELYSAEWISFENICEITNAAIKFNFLRLLDHCFCSLLTSLREGIPIKDIEILDKDFATDLLKKASSIEYC